LNHSICKFEIFEKSLGVSYDGHNDAKRARRTCLSGIEGMRQRQVLALAILVVKAESDGGSFGEFGNSDKVNLVVRLDLLVIGRVLEVEGEHTLLLEVGLVDTSEGSGDDSGSSEETGFESGVFSGRSLTVVLIVHMEMASVHSARWSEKGRKGEKGDENSSPRLR